MNGPNGPNGPSMLEWLQLRRSVRAFTARPVERPVVERLLQAAISAPSNTNRQPWRFAVVTGPETRRRLAEAVRARVVEMSEIIRRGHHAADFADYGDFFFEPLAAASLVIIPQYRPYPDLIAEFIASGGGDPAAYETADAMQAELCSTSAAVMALLLQAQAEGLGGCWMAGPMVARREIGALLDLRAPWRMIGAIALGWPEGARPEARPRKPLDRVASWHEE